MALKLSRFVSVVIQKRHFHVNFVQQNIVKSKYLDAPLSRLPYFDFVWSNKEKYSGKIALVNQIKSLYIYKNA